MAADHTQRAPPSIAADVKPLFTELDRDHMMMKFDLWKYDDVKVFALDFYQALKNQSMPPKGSESQAPWPAEHVALFKAWMDRGFAP